MSNVGDIRRRHIPSPGDLTLSPELEWGYGRCNHISATFLDDDVCTTVVELGGDILVRADSILALNRDSVKRTACRSGMDSRNEGCVENREVRTRVSG